MSEDSPKPAVDTIEILDIMAMIPHRYPMLLVDRVIDLVPDDRATGLKNVTINEGFFQGHFPAKPVMPGVLIVEALAQTAAVLAARTMGEAAKGKLVYFMSIEQARFRKPVVPGDTLHLHVKKTRGGGRAWRFEGEARVDGQKVTEASFAAMIADA